MDKCVYSAVLIAVVMVGVVWGTVATTEAASPVKVVKTLGPRAVVMAKNVGSGISNFLWSNKGTITTGVVLTTFASNPEPFVQGATTVAATAAEKTIEVIVPKVGETIAGAASIGFGPYAILGGLLLLLGLVVVCRKRLKIRRELIAPVIVFLFVFFVICCCGVALRADTIGCVTESLSTGVSPSQWNIILNLLLIILLWPLGM